MATCLSCGKKGILLRLSKDSLCSECQSLQEAAASKAYNELVKSYSGIGQFRKHIDAGNVEEAKACIVKCDEFDACQSSTTLTPAFNSIFIGRAKIGYSRLELPDFEDFSVCGEKDQLGDIHYVFSKLVDTTKARRKMLVQFCESADIFVKVLDSLPTASITVDEKAAPKNPVSESYDVAFSPVTKKTPRDKLGNFVAIDTETTGLSASKDEIVEIAAVRFRDFKPIEKFVALCAPKKGMSEDASRINGITEEMVADKPLFGQIVRSLQSFIGADNIVGHNLDFDLKFIVRGGFDVHANKQKYYDTLEIAQKTLKRAKDKWDKDVQGYITDYSKDYDVMNYKLKTLCDYYGITYLGAHRALADAYVTGLLLQALAKDRE
jgi:DNA polymerase III polC-type